MLLSWLPSFFKRRGAQSLRDRSPKGRRPNIEILEDRWLPSTFTVTNTGDNNGVNPSPGANTGTLRQAIVDANAHAGQDTIQFKIGSGAQTIHLQAALPTLTDSVILDGTTQTGYSGKPLIELDGTGAGAKVDGLVLGGGNSTVKGLVINRFTQNGIAITSSGNVVMSNYVGTDVTGAIAQANGGDGIVVFATGNTIGGTTGVSANVVSGNTKNGVDLVAGNNKVEGNEIGTDPTGKTAVGNGEDGVIVFAGGNTIGGTASGAGNLISGNGQNGIDLVTGSSQVEGNKIGTDTTGKVALGNGADGVNLFSAGNTIGGTTTAAGNLISGNSGNGVEISSANATNNLVEGNRIGTDTSGTTPLGNNGNGVLIFSSGNKVGDVTAGAGNVISGNKQNGVDLVGTGNTVAGNLIGTDITGKVALGNLADGVALFGATNTVGGTTTGAGNVISANAGYGVDVVVGGNTVQGNFVGTTLDGTKPLGNVKDGIIVWGGSNTIGGNTAGAGNVISANGGNGVDLTGSGASQNVVQGNAIGTDLSGKDQLGNGLDGILVEASNNTLGGTTPAGANTIAFNHANGINLALGSGNAVLQNNIYGNALLPIAYGGTAVTNAASAGPAPQYTVVVPHPGKSSLIEVLDAQTGQQVFQFVAFPGFKGNVRWAIMDVNGDGVPDIVVLSMGSKGGRVRIYDGATHQQLSGGLGFFRAFSSIRSLLGLSLVDFNHDGKLDLAIMAKVGSQTMTKVFDSSGKMLNVSMPTSRHLSTTPTLV